MSNYDLWATKIHEQLRSMNSYDLWAATIYEQLRSVNRYDQREATIYEQQRSMNSYDLWTATSMSSYDLWASTISNVQWLYEHKLMFSVDSILYFWTSRRLRCSPLRHVRTTWPGRVTRPYGGWGKGNLGNYLFATHT